MSGAYMDVDKIKELLDSKVHTTSRDNVMRDRILNTCSEQGKYPLKNIKKLIIIKIIVKRHMFSKNLSSTFVTIIKSLQLLYYEK